MDDMLALTTHLPEAHFTSGEEVVREGEPAGALWVLVSGSLTVTQRGVVVNGISRPGALIGEISTLLHTPYGATVQAASDCVLRHAADGAALLAGHPGITKLMAIELAERLSFVTRYLVDLKQQYADAPGLAMVADVLQQLSQRKAPSMQPGSQRDPN
jgi:CRP/FNR family transcriptional regulator, cyclic AMP receptor protein